MGIRSRLGRFRRRVQAAYHVIRGNAPSIAPKLPNYPSLSADGIAENARLFANRIDLIKSLAPMINGKVIGEIGVAQGNFSEVLFDLLNPKEFVAFDLFNIHTIREPWAMKSAEVFQGKTHLEFYKNRFATRNLKTEAGPSGETIKRYPDGYFDLLYIDGDHTYAGVKADADLAIKKIKPDGVLVFNDYIMYDWNDQYFYGIVPVVNDLVARGGYEIFGFAFERTMFCDIALRRKHSQK